MHHKFTNTQPVGWMFHVRFSTSMFPTTKTGKVVTALENLCTGDECKQEIIEKGGLDLLSRAITQHGFNKPLLTGALAAVWKLSLGGAFHEYVAGALPTACLLHLVQNFVEPFFFIRSVFFLKIGSLSFSSCIDQTAGHAWPSIMFYEAPVVYFSILHIYLSQNGIRQLCVSADSHLSTRSSNSVCGSCPISWSIDWDSQFLQQVARDSVVKWFLKQIIFDTKLFN